MVRLLTRTQQHETPQSLQEPGLPTTTQAPSAHQHLASVPILPQLTCLQAFTREKGTKKVGGGGEVRGEREQSCVL